MGQSVLGRTADGKNIELLVNADGSLVTAPASSADYPSQISARVWDFESGAGTDEVTVPADAWVTEVSFTAGLTDASLLITPPSGPAKPLITVPAGGSYSAAIPDTGQLAGGTFAFSDAGEWVITYAREP